MCVRDRIKYVILNYRSKFNFKEVGFLENMRDSEKITTKQAEWLIALLAKAGFQYDMDFLEDNFVVRASKPKTQKKPRKTKKEYCDHGDLGSMGYRHGDTVICPFCGERAEVW